MIFNVFHTQERRDIPLTFPLLAQGFEQWLGDGYYFWQESEFAMRWGYARKCGFTNKSRQFEIYSSTLQVNDDDFIDTVFNEAHYNSFVRTIESFAARFIAKYHQKPTLEEFNEFVYDHDLWGDIQVIRFQDLPDTNHHIKVTKFYYKKRIQFRVNDPAVITKFERLNIINC